ncbi:secretion-regulating guanine nucleotide exchange factor isoform X7 [Rattus norvegicus]|uniref:secretion-regulating guanine nucleotide exchange factor isoform X7 n=1 Tax=Rattus norvegicus TaxID=10116 RepID=UPI0003D0C247|nr:secretion-regulating guanine nucleotide exchange factor isoform X7 [Rattus norvegicus]|eukprot:XP_006229291.1 PREDICTED: secretion-regulating guanine nucleotide exchange factor isoform X4 [Rattus norvegicus]
MARESCASEAVSAAAVLFAWGANSYGQLGLGHKEDVLLPQQLSDFCKSGCIKSVTGGGGHSVVVTDGGGLFVCGLNKDGQLGLGHTEEVLRFTICKPLLGCPIRQVACGWDFTIMLTEKGQVLSCGSNAFGQLGVPHGPRKCVVPQAIECLREKVVCVAAGLRHALATTDTGSTFQWGTGLASSGRRLCPGQNLPLFLTAKEPSRVTGLESSTVVCAVAGSDHSASLTETGKVFTWGRADYGQLGRTLGSPEAQKHGEQDSSLAFQRLQNSVPSPLHCLTGAAEVSCGSEHNLAVIRDKCCSWGWNEHGMCGDGTESNVWTPTPVQALPSPSRLLLVGCGAGHSLALCQLPAHPAPCQDLTVTCPLPDATETTESQGAVDRERQEGETIGDFNPKPF